jgi:hypothetical protein
VALFAALGLAPFVAGGIGTITLGGFEVSGVRLTILLGGTIAFASALPSGIDMIRRSRRLRRESR